MAIVVRVAATVGSPGAQTRSSRREARPPLSIAASDRRRGPCCRGYDAAMVGCRETGRGVAAALFGCAALIAAGCGSGSSGSAAQPSATRTAATSVLATGAARRALAARYLVIARAGNERLEDDFDPLEKRDRDNLVRADADLRDASATEQLFDRRLLRIDFPAQAEGVARGLYRVNQARAKLTIAASASTSLPPDTS
jgi:hypothetical protein